MTDKQTILLKAGKSALAVDAAKAAVETAKLVLDQAKADLDAVKSAYDAALDECEAAGIPKAKARKAVDALNQVWIDAGLVDAPEAAAEPSQVSADADKAPRKKRRGKGDQAAEPAMTQTSPSVPAEAPAVPAAVAPTAIEPDTGEIEALIDDALSDHAPELSESYSAASSLLRALLSARAWSAAQGEEGSIDAESFRTSLNLADAASLAAEPGLPASNAQALSKGIADKDTAEHVLSWFDSYLTAIENGASGVAEPLFSLTATDAEPAVGAVGSSEDGSLAKETASETALAAESTLSDDEFAGLSDEENAEDEELPDLPDFDEGYEDLAEEDAPDDDSSFPIEDGHELYAEEDAAVVGDIGEINFLEEETGAEPEAAAAPAKEPEKTAAGTGETPTPPKPARPTFAPPAFLKSK